MTRPLLIDLFCGGGGAAMGYHQAGFDVIGVDLVRQPHYPFPFIQADALAPPIDLDRAALIHASPVCKRWSQVTRTSVDPDHHPDQIAPIRELLQASGRPYVIENVPRSPLVDPVLLCGSMFDLDVQRHRLFETNWPLRHPDWPCRHGIWAPRFAPARGTGRARTGKVVTVSGGGGHGHGQFIGDWRRAMQIDWLPGDRLAQAIPPAYTRHIGEAFMAQIGAAA